MATDKFISVITKCIRNNTKTIRIKLNKGKPWINNNLIMLIKNKSILYKQTKKYPENDMLGEEYRTYKNKLQIL